MRMGRIPTLICCVLLWIPLLGRASLDYASFDLYQGKLTRGEIEEKLVKFLRKDSRVEGYFELTNDELRVFSALPTQSSRVLEYTLALSKENPIQEGQLEVKEEPSLVGVKIAIDPGHFGGPFCRIEERYIDIPPSLDRDYPLRFDEGTLSYLTARYIQVLFEREGAIVLLTRKGIGQGCQEADFFDWLRNHPELWSTEPNLKKLFKLYNVADLHARADKINAFQPDLTLVIHYNAHHMSEAEGSNTAITPANFNMVFVPGAFSGDELAEKENRTEFLRLLVSKDLSQSLELSRNILSRFTERLSIPIVQETDGARYLTSACLKVEEGIYARNLALTRLIHGPVCYGESLVQNNIDESLNLSRTDFFIDGTPCSSRVKQVAESYFEGIKGYLKNRQFHKMTSPST